ncbi:RDD family protein [Flavobacterium sp. Fl-77]|uniref:RDD family protein n=1 Tax=Flavobacterium flavipigmentatum TaxID=2893884 RepID=A0AAJ2S7K5_9FLAO|nr:MULTISPECIES: RDD family protein [unclassified Flavobacterium]MDX6181380.1 RDD family protein [Flavobacterium sp. Fl-33]MDX6184982.1 RDD family protein [Flavobacterium sp. Fl-77]UFH40074.1 RDD family protein [Flavobacterium sp. F-70]
MNDSIYILDDALVASSGKRFLNYIIDMIFFVIAMYLFGLFLGILIALGFEGVSFWMQGLGDLGWNLIGITILLVYYTLTEGFFGRSVGKFITGTVVVDENGEKINFGSALKRSLCRLIPFDGLSFFGSRGWHDSITDTYVVEKKALEESIKMFHDFKLIGVEEAS